jgi:hypothetical protein
MRMNAPEDTLIKIVSEQEVVLGKKDFLLSVDEANIR